MPDLVEHVVTMPVRNPDTTGKSNTFRYAGKVDKVEDRELQDWKHAADPQQTIAQSRLAFQPELYALALLEEGIEIDRYEYRLIVPPGIKFKKAAYTWAVRKVSRKTAIKVCDNEDEAKRLANMRGGYVEPRVAGNPTRDHYENECYEWIHDRPGERMVSHPLQILPSRMEMARGYLWDCGKRILDCRRNDRWMPNAQACRDWGRTCPYAELCASEMEGGDTAWLIGEYYTELPSPHPELDGLGADRDLLTFTSTGVLCQCEVRYFWMFEQALRKHADAGDALWRGSAIHVGLEVYARQGREPALAAIDAWADEHPVLGGDWRKQEQEIAKARAMVRAAADKWPIEGGAVSPCSSAAVCAVDDLAARPQF